MSVFLSGILFVVVAIIPMDCAGFWGYVVFLKSFHWVLLVGLFLLLFNFENAKT